MGERKRIETPSDIIILILLILLKGFLIRVSKRQVSTVVDGIRE